MDRPSIESSDREVIDYFAKLSSSNYGTCKYAFDNILPNIRSSGFDYMFEQLRLNFISLHYIGVAKLADLEHARPGLMSSYDVYWGVEDLDLSMIVSSDSSVVCISESSGIVRLNGRGTLDLHVWDSDLRVIVPDTINLRLSYSGEGCKVHVESVYGSSIISSRFNGMGELTFSGNGNLKELELDVWG